MIEMEKLETYSEVHSSFPDFNTAEKSMPPSAIAVEKDLLRYTQKLEDLRKQCNCMITDHDQKKTEANIVIADLKQLLYEEESKHEELEKKIEMLTIEIEAVKQQCDPLQGNVEAELQKEEENLLNDTISKREKYKLMEDCVLKRNNILAQILGTQQSIILQEEELRRTKEHCTLKLQCMYNRLQLEAKEKIEAVISEVKEMIEKELPFIMKQKSNRAYFNRIILKKIAREELKLLERNEVLEKKEKEIKVDLEILEELKKNLLLVTNKMLQVLIQTVEDKQRQISFKSSCKNTPANENGDISKTKPKSIIFQESSNRRQESDDIGNNRVHDKLQPANSEAAHLPQLHSNRFAFESKLQPYQLGWIGLVKPTQKLKLKKRKKFSNNLENTCNIKDQDTDKCDVVSLRILSELGLIQRRKKMPAKLCLLR